MSAESAFPGLSWAPQLRWALGEDVDQFSPKWTDSISTMDPCTCDDCCARGGWARFALYLERRASIWRSVGRTYQRRADDPPKRKPTRTFVHMVAGKRGRPRKVAA